MATPYRLIFSDITQYYLQALLLCAKTHGTCTFLNACMLILLSLVMTHNLLSDYHAFLIMMLHIFTIYSNAFKIQYLNKLHAY